jgi:tRNA U34 5-methylaminomethyl-2-thiouridine-forming methyltransferase MnmC
LQREIITTSDGSTTIRISDWDECYHSKHGAIVEAYHVFIKNGLTLFGESSVSIMEIGFGTGLNAFITFLESQKKNQHIAYTGVEAYPVSAEEVAAMNYVSELHATEYAATFDLVHATNWNIPEAITPQFFLTKRQQFFDQIEDEQAFDLIYFDAFGYRVQPELWSTEIFRRMYKALKPNGVLVTYAARGVVKRSMIEVGFSVEKLDGPPGKREMFRARKGAAS